MRFIIRNLFLYFIMLGLGFASCTAPAVIVSPNQMHNVPGTLYLSNGEAVAGHISINTEVLFPKDIMVAPAQGAVQQIHLLEVQSMELNNKVYELKHKRNNLKPSSGFYFMERLTPADAKMHLYVHLERRQTGKSLQQVKYEPTYYLQLPGEKQHRVWASDSKKLMPHFEQKMSKVVSNCPSLADSIRLKKNGLFYSRFNSSEEQRGKILKTIVDAYNSCD